MLGLKKEKKWGWVGENIQAKTIFHLLWNKVFYPGRL